MAVERVAMEHPVFTPPFEPVAGQELRQSLRRKVKMRAHLRDKSTLR